MVNVFVLFKTYNNIKDIYIHIQNEYLVEKNIRHLKILIYLTKRIIYIYIYIHFLNKTMFYFYIS